MKFGVVEGSAQQPHSFFIMRFTRVTLYELEQLRAFAEHTFRIAFEQDNDPERFEVYCQHSFSVQQMQSELRNPASQFWFAWEAEILAGYLKLNFDEHPTQLGSLQTVKVERLYVDPTLQSRGIGSKMLDFALEQAHEVKAEWIWLSVWQVKPRSIQFYQRCGYEIFGEETFWLAEEAQMDWLMKKPVVANL